MSLIQFCLAMWLLSMVGMIAGFHAFRWRDK